MHTGGERWRPCGDVATSESWDHRWLVWWWLKTGGTVVVSKMGAGGKQLVMARKWVVVVCGKGFKLVVGLGG